MDADPRDIRIQELEAENQALRQRVAELEPLRALVIALQQRVEELQRTAARQAAPFRRKDKKKKPPDQHKLPGRRQGHTPSFRPPPKQIDDNVDMRLDQCPGCGGSVTHVQPCVQYIEDIPVIRPHVTKLTTYVGHCSCCGEVRSVHPLQVSTACGAAGTHLGRRALSLAAWLNKHLGLTMRKTCRVLHDLSGLHLTPGGLSQALERMAHKLSPTFESLIHDLRNQPAVWADETSWWVGGPGWWLWTFTTPEMTVYRVDRSRGRDVVFDILGTEFKGVLTSDCLATYENLPFKMQKCYAHHLKAISEAAEDHPSAYLDQLRGLLRAAITLQALRQDLPPPEWTEKRQRLEDRADELLLRTTPPLGAAQVAERLKKRRQWLFTFLDDPALEATNNRAERSLRPAVIARKLSCGNKTESGKRTWEVLTSLAATCHQRSQDFAEFIRPQLSLIPTPAR
jgi:hypothetical protein